MEPSEILIRPVITESTFNLIEKENKLVFIVNRKANKKMIKGAIEKTYSVKCKKINSMVTPRGEKKVYIRLDPANSASEVANKMGIF